MTSGAGVAPDQTPEPAPRSVPDAERARARRELTVTVLLCAAGALIELLAIGRPWLRLTKPSGMVKNYTGSSVAGTVKPLALLSLAGAGALLATKRWGRTAVGVLVVAAAVGSAVAAIVAGDPSAAGTIHQEPAWRLVTVAAALPILAAGLSAAARGARWSVMSARYDAPGTAKPRAQDPDVALWDALDRGDDPTG